MQLDAVASANAPIFANIAGVDGTFSDAELVISDRGIGLCAHVPPFGWDAGAGAHLSPSQRALILAAGLTGPAAPLYITTYLAANADYTTATGCNIAQFRSVPESGSSARAAAVGQQFDVPSGEKVALVAIDGSGGRPAVTLDGPGGRTIDATHNLNTATAFVFRPNPTQTVVEIGGANAGRWTIVPAAGSPAITKVETSHPLAAPAASGRVSGSGAARVLRYRITNVPAGTRITLADRDARGALVPIATTTKLSGQLRFTPSDLPAGRRTIVALPMPASGVPMPQLTVTQYTGAPAAVGRVDAVTTRRTGSSATVSFAPVRGASGYAVAIRLSDGRNLAFNGAADRITVPRIGAKVRVVSVIARAQRAGRYGAPRTTSSR
jgi:hypothetical protein